MFSVYVLYSESYNKIYIGQTIDLSRRLVEHNNGTFAGYTKKFIPWKIIYTEVYGTRSEAFAREKQLKSQKGREFVWKLIKTEGVAGSIR